MWSWDRSIKRITWIDRVKNEEVLRIVKEERNMLLMLKREKNDGIGRIVRRSCLLKHVFEGEIEGKI
jgi:hypothetical protein